MAESTNNIQHADMLYLINVKNQNHNIKILILILLICLANLRITAQEYQADVESIIQKMDSILIADSLKNRGYQLESKTIGYSSSKSNIYSFYKELLEASETNELLKIISDSTLKTPIRAYAYMAYAYHVDSLNIREEPTDYNFTVTKFVGCIVRTHTFKDFKTKARVRGLNNPYPRKFPISKDEIKAIEIENDIREEQGIPKRDEKK